jgi:hypothetical protein
MFKVGDIVVYCGGMIPFNEYEYRDGRELEVTRISRRSIDVKCKETDWEWLTRDQSVFTLAFLQLEND